jgi:hypothetical protein
MSAPVAVPTREATSLTTINEECAVSLYIKTLQQAVARQAEAKGAAPPNLKLRQRLEAWHSSLPLASRNRPFAMSESWSRLSEQFPANDKCFSAGFFRQMAPWGWG